MPLVMAAPVSFMQGFSEPCGFTVIFSHLGNDAGGSIILELHIPGTFLDAKGDFKEGPGPVPHGFLQPGCPLGTEDHRFLRMLSSLSSAWTGMFGWVSPARSPAPCQTSDPQRGPPMKQRPLTEDDSFQVDEADARHIAPGSTSRRDMKRRCHKLIANVQPTHIR